MKLLMVTVSALVLAACGGGPDESIPIDAAVAIDGPPPIDAPVVDAPIDGLATDAPATAGCVASIGALTVDEGATATVAVMLAAQPQGAAVCSVAAADPTAISAAPAALTFTPANWDTPQIVTVSGLQDADAVDDQTELSITTTGAPATVVAVTVVDDD